MKLSIGYPAADDEQRLLQSAIDGPHDPFELSEPILKDYATGADCHQGLQAYLTYYCHERPHQSLANQTPWHAFQTPRRRPR